MTTAPNALIMRANARAIFDEALKAVDPATAVQRSIKLSNGLLRIQNQEFHLAENVYAIATGKAALAMASGLDQAIRGRIKSGIISTKSNLPPAPHWIQFSGGHPEPNEQSLAAARACFELLARADQERATVFFLISGGGSAMLEWPLSHAITLEDLRLTNRVLVASGATIGEINCVRRALSAIKGGRLASHAPNCQQVTLIVSDVPAGEEHNVASGPSLSPIQTRASPQEVVARYDLGSRLPKTVLRALDSETANAKTEGAHFVLLDNGTTLEAAAANARRQSLCTEIAAGISDQPIEDGCVQLLERLEVLSQQNAPANDLACLISGGEFACPVNGDGMGGRNLETALRLALLYPTDGPPFVALCAGTDGIDGNSPAAGAIVDHTTISRAQAIGLDSKDFLARSDAYSFFVALGDVVATGPTGTNVRDIRILLRANS